MADGCARGCTLRVRCVSRTAHVSILGGWIESASQPVESQFLQFWPSVLQSQTSSGSGQSVHTVSCATHSPFSLLSSSQPSPTKRSPFLQSPS